MRPILRWAHMMSSTVTVAPRVSKDVYGVPTYGDTTTYTAHLARGARLTPEAQALGIIDAVHVWLNSNVAIQPTAQVTLSTGDVGSTESFDRQPRLIGVERLFDESRAHHTVLYVGWAPRSV